MANSVCVTSLTVFGSQSGVIQPLEGSVNFSANVMKAVYVFLKAILLHGDGHVDLNVGIVLRVIASRRRIGRTEGLSRLILLSKLFIVKHA